MDFKMSGFALPVLFVSVLFLTTGCGVGDTSVAEKSALLTEPVPPGEIAPPPDESYQPDLGVARAVGFYSSGSLESAENFPDSGNGFLKLFLPRDRGWATRSLINTITHAAASVLSQYPNGERLQIGDASSYLGGYVSGHASHQNGLDVDLRYYAVDQREVDPNYTGGFSEYFVKNGEVTSNFDLARNWALVKSMVGSGIVSRMFVDPAIKAALCVFRGTAEATEALRRLRPYTNHANHIHVRIRCPANSTSCVAQSELPSGDGC